MIRLSFFFIFLVPLVCRGQFLLTGKVLNQSDGKPVINASVFLNNATVGAVSTIDGSYILRNAKPGKYELIISCVGFEPYKQSLVIANNNKLPDIFLLPKTFILSEVKVSAQNDPNREIYYKMFTDEFLGTSEIAAKCRILNPEQLDFTFNKSADQLTASSSDFLIIENDALGYQIKYMLSDFLLKGINSEEKRIYYKGAVLFQELKGTPRQQERWKTNRQQLYDNSPMHFLRSALAKDLKQTGFRVQRLVNYSNPKRPSDSLIRTKIKYYSSLRNRNTAVRDSIAYWYQKQKLPKILEQLMPDNLNSVDLIRATPNAGIYELGCDNDQLFVSYNKSQNFHVKNNLKYLYNPGNDETTLIKFTGSNATFTEDGVFTNPYSIAYFGVWGRRRVAELLPVDYSAPPVENDLESEQKFSSAGSGVNDTVSGPLREKAYLQFDKPFYAAGDTVYFKAYLTKGEKHQLSDISGVLNVILTNGEAKFEKRIKLPVINGLTWGDFALPDSMPRGEYSIVAFTQWMKNTGDESYFKRVLNVASTFEKKVTESGNPAGTITRKTDLTFMPEGGILFEDIPQKIAFKAIGANGFGMDVNGDVFDNNNKKICSFSSQHLGMGYFNLTPKAGKTYTAMLNYADGSRQTIALPVAASNGITLNINNDSLRQTIINIYCNERYFNANKNRRYKLVIKANDKITTITCVLNSNAIKLEISKSEMQSGIAVATLYSPQDEALCERLFFIQNFDQLALKVNAVGPAVSRSKMSVNINALDMAGQGISGHFSAAVIDESKLPVNDNGENTILSDLLLTSDLKGYVEQPNYYFKDSSLNTLKQLDLVMLTNGYRKFVWKQSPDFLPEKGLQISGAVTSLNNKPVLNGSVTLLPATGGMLNTLTDEHGIFNFKNLNYPDSTHFILSAVNQTGSNSIRLSYFTSKPDRIKPLSGQTLHLTADSSMEKYLLLDKNFLRNTLNRSGRGFILREVKIKQRKPAVLYKTQSLAGAGSADQVLHSEDVKNGTTLASALSGKLHGIVFNGGVPYLTMPHSAHMAVYVDGAVISDDDKNFLRLGINGLNPNDIETIEVLKYAGASMYGMNGGNGVLIITTKQGGGLHAGDIKATGVLQVIPTGFYQAREFYSPKYDVAVSNRQPDLRSTIYWQPELLTDANGNASFNFFNADGTGTYRICIEGIDSNGNLGRQVFRYQVK